MSEDPIHIGIVNYLRTVLPHGWIVQHTANKPRSKAQGAREKRMGAIAGWPDIAVYGVRAQHTAFGPLDKPAAWFLEVKAPRGRVSDEQSDVHDRLKDIGFPVAVVRSIDDVRAKVAEWGLPSRDVSPTRITITPAE